MTKSRWTFAAYRRFTAPFQTLSALAALTLTTSSCVKSTLSSNKKSPVQASAEQALPSLTWTAPAASSWVNIANAAAVTVSGTCSKAVEGQSVLLRAPGPASALATCASGVFSTSMDFTAVSEGTFSLTADVTDTSGNAADQISLSLQKDTVAPTLAFSSPAASAYVQNSLVLSGTCSDNGQTVSLAGTGSLTGSATCTAGAWNATIDITTVADGAITWTADFSDAAGNPAAQTTRGFIKDLSVPTVAITSPAAGAYINIANKAAFTVSGTCSESGRTVSIAAGAVTATPNCTGGNTWTATLDLTSLSDGTVTVTADHTNVAAVAATQASRSFNKDTVAPTVALTAPLASVKIVTSNQSAFTVSGTCSEVGQNVVISGDASATVSCVAGNTWSYSADVSSKADGVISFSSDHSDAAGNPATQSSRNYTKDTTAPAAFTITGVTGGADVTADAYLLDNTTAVIEWNDTTGEDSYDVVIKKASDNSVMCALVNKAADSTNHDFSACTLSYGQDYKAIVIAKDSDGNEREATNSPFTFKVNRVPTAVAETKFVAKNASATTLTVLSNDTDPDSDTLTVASVNTTGTSGTVTNNTTDVSYTPTSGFTGIDTFTYTATDSRGGTSTATVTVKVMDPFTWTGGGGNVNWNQSGNWCGSVTAGACAGGAAPNSSQVAIFDGTCTSNCSPTINAAINVAGIKLNSGYSGTVTQGTGNTITIGSTGYTQTAGTFSGSASNITISGPFALSGGSWTSTSGTLSVSGSYSVSGSPSFSANGGSLTFGGNGQSITVGTESYNHVTFSKNNTGTDTLTGTMTIGGNLTLNATSYGPSLNGGTLNVAGNLSILGNCWDGGTATIRLVGAAGSSITVTGSGSGSYIGGLEIASAGTVTFASTGSIDISKNFTYTSGTVVTTGSTFKFRGQGSVSPGAMAFENVFFDFSSSSASTLTGTLTVNGNLTFNSGSYGPSLNGGTVNVSGNLNILGSTWRGGSAVIRLVGGVGSSVTVTGSGSGSRVGYLEIASAGSVTFATTGSIDINNSLTYTSGTVVATGSTVRFVGASAISPGAMELGNVAFIHNTTAASTLTGTLAMSGNLSFNTSSQSPSINGGTIDVAGNLSMDGDTWRGGTTAIRLVGGVGSSVTVSGTGAGSYIGSLEVASAGTVTFSTTGSIDIGGGFTYTSGTVVAAGSTVRFVGSGTISSGAMEFGHATFRCSNFSVYAISGTMKVPGNLSFIGVNYAPTATGGTIETQGGLSVSGSWAGGTTQIVLTGSGVQSISQSSGKFPGTTLTVNSATSVATLASTVNLNNGTQNMTVTAGAVDMAGFNLTVPGTLSLNGNTLTKNGGTLTVGSGSSPYGGTVNP